MEFVNVTASMPWSRIRLNDDVTMASVNLTKRSLVSIIGGLKQKRAGPDTIQNQMYEIEAYRKRFVQPCHGRLYIDSGGYSIITGEVDPQNIRKAIKLYNLVLEHYPKSYDNIFTLDIPVLLKAPSLNTKANLFQLNYESLFDTKKFLEKSLELQNKVFFIWHFKVFGQYHIWKNIYSDLGLNDYIKNRAIGGLVGLNNALMKAGRKIDFSPVIALSFRCLLDHLKKKTVDKIFCLHYLGVKMRSDRFIIALIERLFKIYLRDISEVVFTYDSIHYNTSAMLSTKTLVNCWHFHENQIENYENIFSVSNKILQSIYFNDQMYCSLNTEIENLKRGKKLNNAGILSPLNIYSNMQLDLYFKYTIKKYSLAELIYRSKTDFDVYPKLKKMLEELKLSQPNIFTNKLTKQIYSSIEYIYKFHKWYCIRRDYESLDELIDEFVKTINFPMVLR